MGATETVASDELIEEVLSFNIVKRFLVHQEHSNLMRQIAALEQNENAILQSDYINVVRLQIKHELFEHLKLPTFGEFEQTSCLFTFSHPEHMIRPLTRSVTGKPGDLVLFSFEPLWDKRDFENIGPEQI